MSRSHPSPRLLDQALPVGRCPISELGACGGASAVRFLPFRYSRALMDGLCDNIQERVLAYVQVVLVGWLVGRLREGEPNE